MSAAHKTIDNTNKAADAAGENVRAYAETAQDTLRSGMNSASESARRFTDQMTQAYGLSGEKREALTHQASQNLEVISEAGAVLTRGVQDITREWLSLLQESQQKNLDGFNALVRCRSLPDFMAVQSGLIRDNLGQAVESTRRITEASARVANEATQTLTALTKKTRRAA